MKIAHTSDWHAGRFFKRVDRLPELASVLENLGDELEQQRVELLLVSGDVFDSGAPVAEAERTVFHFFKRIGRAGIQTVVIAGNHDSPARVEAWGALAELVGVHAVARPMRSSQGGVVSLETRSGAKALVAAVPFAAPRELVSAMEMADDDLGSRQIYARGMRDLVAEVTTPFRSDRVNLLMLHTHLEGALFSGSERSIHLGDEWAARPSSLPGSAHYVALGHIHRPQSVDASPAPARYAGSPLQLDFGESGEEKSFVLIDARPRQPARIQQIPYRGGRPLLRVRHSLAELEREQERLKGGWLWVTVPLEAPDPDLASKVRRLLPNALRIEVELPSQPQMGPTEPSRLSMDQAELYCAYHQHRHQCAPEPDVIDTFRELSAAEPAD